MIGSLYRGFQSLGQNYLHINGNALYHLSLSFILFLQYVSYEYPYDSKQSSGYDLDLFLYLFKHIDKGKKFWHKFQFSDFIQNCWHTGCNEMNEEFLYNNPNTYLIHELIKDLQSYHLINIPSYFTNVRLLNYSN
ncbi:unnamed protein product [Rotaria sordida]|uniref:Uncharacterized protein n=2 Tax=Rotaria sordida TaxID=392033 RepID=A0A819WUW6_9BILA|nr:unnamed protein product [Rotaria sordida]